jgi:hypothetical protein
VGLQPLQRRRLPDQLAPAPVSLSSPCPNAFGHYPLVRLGPGRAAAAFDGHDLFTIDGGLGLVDSSAPEKIESLAVTPEEAITTGSSGPRIKQEMVVASPQEGK